MHVKFSVAAAKEIRAPLVFSPPPVKDSIPSGEAASSPKNDQASPMPDNDESTPQAQLLQHLKSMKQLLSHAKKQWHHAPGAAVYKDQCHAFKNCILHTNLL